MSHGQPTDENGDSAQAIRVRELELELQRVRSEATVARLEARAAELELMLARSGQNSLHVQATATGEAPQATGHTPAADQRLAFNMPPPSSQPLHSWEPLTAASFRRRSTPPEPPKNSAPSFPPPLEAATDRVPAPTTPTSDPAPRALSPLLSHILTGPTRAPLPSPDKSPSPARTTPAALFDPIDPAPANETPPTQPTPGDSPPVADPSRPQTRTDRSHPLPRAKGLMPPAGQHNPSPSNPSPSNPSPSTARAVPAVAVTAESEPPETSRRKKPAAWLVSTLLHLVVLLLLAALSLSVHRPQDQVALSASPASAAEPESLETLELEALDEPVETSQTEPTEAPMEIDPLGDIPTPEVASLDPMATAFTPDPADAISDAITSSALSSALASDSEATTKFCGVEGGGNHFVYLVDSSQSMKNGRFESARRELLQSIDELKPDQRFYVIFYDTNVDRMCVSHPTEPDEYSVMASPKNKQAVRRWAMSVGLERGAPPDEALEFALKLRPDVIFLLSDGEFPQRIEDMMAEKNSVSNLFGDSGPISILHTIGYHSRDGETRMRRLAEANGGQYRYIPSP